MLIFHKPETSPEFPGGNKALLKFIAKNLKYPNPEVHAKVYVRFVVSAEGYVKNIEIVRGVDKRLDIEAVRVVSILPRWTPGKQDGKAVDVYYTVPVNFQLQ